MQQRNIRVYMLLLSAAVPLLAAPANRQLAGVNNEWVDPLGLMLSPHYDAQGHEGGWLPPNISGWVNASRPLMSEPMVALLRALKLSCDSVNAYEQHAAQHVFAHSKPVLKAGHGWVPV